MLSAPTFPSSKALSAAAELDRVKLVSIPEAEFGLKYGLLIKERRYFPSLSWTEKVSDLCQLYPHHSVRNELREVLEEARKVL